MEYLFWLLSIEDGTKDVAGLLNPQIIFGLSLARADDLLEYACVQLR
jgi:hypothetical protein